MATISDAADAFPAAMRADLVEAVEESTAPTVAALLGREGIAPPVALMAGLALDPVGRPLLDAALQRFASVDRELPAEVEEVVVGGGAHAAIYCSVRVALGFPRPWVVEQRPRFGGVFALGERPAFFLNSRNRPGRLGRPGTVDALNFLPGAPMQPSDIGSTEYQTDADLGLIVRCALALNSVPSVGTVESVRPVGNRPAAAVALADGRTVTAKRVVVATGLTAERTVNGIVPDGRTIYSSRQWFERVGSERFPLRDLGRVAVIGGGDSARTVVESLTGIGPSAGSTVAALDYVDRLDWYGIGEGMSKARWCEDNRSRYQRIGALLPAARSDNARIVGYDRARLLAPGYLAAEVDGRTYDTVITAVGYDSGGTLDLDSLAGLDYISDPAGRRLGATDGQTVFLVGPAAGIPFDPDESTSIGENKVGLFRLAPRTAALAAQLDR